MPCQITQPNFVQYLFAVLVIWAGNDDIIRIAHSTKLTRLVETCGSSNGFSFYNQQRNAKVGHCVASVQQCTAAGGQLIADDGQPAAANISTRTSFNYGCSNNQICCSTGIVQRDDTACSTCSVAQNSNQQWFDWSMSTATQNEFCWHVLIADSNTILGSGALISRNHVLTAASVIAG